jgi:hypothetical protein
VEQKIIINKLDEFIRKFYKNQLLKGVIYSSGILVLLFLFVITAEYFGEFGIEIRTVLFYTFLLSGFYVVFNFIVLPLLKLNKLGKVISHEEAATIIGKHFGSVQDKLLNVLQLQQNKSDVYSQELLQAGIQQKIIELKPLAFTSAIDFKENIRYLKYALIPLFLLLIISIVAPKILSIGSERIINHTSTFEKQAPFRFTIKNKNLDCFQQKDFDLQVELSGDEFPNELFITINQAEYQLKKESNSTFSYTFKNVQSSIPFSLNGAGFTSNSYLLNVLPKPSLSDFSCMLDYPAYLNRSDETIANTGDLVVPEGTKITWKLRTKNANELQLLFDDTNMRISPVRENEFTLSRLFLQSSNYAIVAGNQFAKGIDSVNYSIQVIKDAYPEIMMSETKDSLREGISYFSGNIKDDYGFNRFQFITTISSKDSSGKLTVKSTNELLSIQKNASSQSVVFASDFQKLQLKPGDRIDYYFEVFDNDGVHGPKSAKSQLLTFKAPTLEEMENQLSEKNKDIKNDLDESIKKAKDLQKQITDLNRNVLEKKQLGWEEKKKLENLIDKQKNLEEQIQQIQQQNDINQQNQNRFQQPDESILEKQQQLEQLFENIMTPEMKKLFEELQKLMEKMDKNKVQETLEKMDLSNKDIQKELDRTLEQFKEMEAQQKMENLAQKLDELSKKQDELSNQSDNKNSDSKELNTKQEELNKLFDQVKEDAKELNELNKELENPMMIPDMKEEEQNVDKEQQNASDQLKQNNKKNASKSQKNAAKQMKSMSEKMENAMEQMEQDQNSEDIQSLRQVMENLMHVSFEEEELIKKSQKIKTNDPQYNKIAQQQKKLQDDSKMIEDSLLALSKRNPMVSASINREISAIQMNMKKAIAALAERQTGEALVREQNAMTSINNLALLLNESLEQMQMQAQKQQQSKPGSGSCKKPGGKQGKPGTSNIREMQQSLNKQLEQMKKMLEEQGKNPNGKKPGEQKGNKPGGKTGNGGMMPGGNSEQFAKMAAQQEAIRRAIQEAMKGIQKKEGNEPGGDLAKKMEETETDLVNKMITQETIKRQQEILTKLLEHEKAEREREMDEKRQSNESKNENFSNQNLFLEYKRLKEQELELLKTVPASLNPYYKQKVNIYLNNFSNTLNTK